MFTGFTQKTIDFMWGIRLNNNKSWFEEHKDDFKCDFQTPMKQLDRRFTQKLPLITSNAALFISCHAFTRTHGGSMMAGFTGIICGFR